MFNYMYTNECHYDVENIDNLKDANLLLSSNG